MATSAQYLADLGRIEKDIDNENIRQKQYERLLETSSGTQSAVSNAESLISNASDSLKNGGYPQEGIEIKSDNLEEILGNLGTIITNTTNELDKIENKLKKLNADYNDTYAAYLNAIRIENQLND